MTAEEVAQEEALADRPGSEEAIIEYGARLFEMGKAEGEALRAEMLALLRKVAMRIPGADYGDPSAIDDFRGACAVCSHDPDYPEQHPTHRPDCKLAALLARIDGAT